MYSVFSELGRSKFVFEVNPVQVWNVYAGICRVFRYLKHRILSTKLALIFFYLYRSQFVPRLLGFWV